MARPVFYFDFNSPYAYLAAARIDDFVPDAERRPIAFPAAVFAAEQGREREFARTAFDKVFVESRSLADPGTLRDAAAELGLDPDEVAEANELYWGDDRLEEAAAALARG